MIFKHFFPKYIFLFCFVCTTVIFPQKARGQENLSVFGYWNYYENVPATSLYKHLLNRAFSQIEQRNEAIGKLKTQTDWQKRRMDVKVKLARAVGPFPEKTLLNPVITGTIKREDYTVEKLYFESRPGYFVTAAMFIPDKRPGKLPAIIYCSGHSPNGFRSAVYQRIMLNYVKKGFVVLAFDPVGQGDRIQYPEKKMSPVDEHSFPGTQSFISGMPPANYFIWDGIRAVDYLVSRKEVDPTRIGITGRSGGGTQSAYIAAMDERILAAAPECYITTFDKLMKSQGPQDAEQNLLNGLASGLDIADFLEVRVPKPALIVATTNDIFSIQGARDVYAETLKAYKAFGKSDQFTLAEDDAGHASTAKNREASYAFFQQHLNNPGDPADVDVKVFTDEELRVSPQGKPWGETIFSLNRKLTNELIAKRTHQRTVNPGYRAGLLEKIISMSGYEKPSGAKDVIFSGRIQRSGYAIEKYLVRGNGDYYLPVLWLKPRNTSGKKVLLLNEGGKSAAAMPGGLADRMAAQGLEVILPDLSGTGELSPGYMKGGDSEINGVPLNLWFTGILTHKSLVAVRAEEIAIIADFVKRTTAQPTELAAAAVGTLTSDLLHATAINKTFSKVVLINPLTSYQSIAEEKYYKPVYALSSVAGALPVYDLPDLITMTGKEQLLLINPVNAAGEQVSQSVIGDVYGSLKNSAGAPDIRSGVAEKDFSKILLELVR